MTFLERARVGHGKGDPLVGQAVGARGPDRRSSASYRGPSLNRATIASRAAGLRGVQRPGGAAARCRAAGREAVRKLPIVSSRMTREAIRSPGPSTECSPWCTSRNAGRSTVRPQTPKEMNVRQPLEVVVFRFA